MNALGDYIAIVVVDWKGLLVREVFCCLCKLGFRINAAIVG